MNHSIMTVNCKCNVWLTMYGYEAMLVPMESIYVSYDYVYIRMAHNVAGVHPNIINIDTDSIGPTSNTKLYAVTFEY